MQHSVHVTSRKANKLRNSFPPQCFQLVTVSRVSVEERGSLAKVPYVYYISSCREESVGRGGEEEILNYRISTWMATTVRWTRRKEGGREGGREGGGEKVQ